jgi:hypothetical protein
MTNRFKPGTPGGNDRLPDFLKQSYENSKKGLNWRSPGLQDSDVYASIRTYPVENLHLPAISSLVRNQYPSLSTHQRNKVVDIARQHFGSLFNGDFSSNATVLASLGFLQPDIPAKAPNSAEYARRIQVLAQSETAKDIIKYAKEMAERSSVEGQQGYGSFPQTDFKVNENQPANQARVAEKQTLAATFIDPGTDVVDSTIPKKVESQVNMDFFSYYGANPEKGMYNNSYLQQMQWEKEVRYKDPMFLPCRGDDQLYFPGFELRPGLQNQQPVEEELLEKLTNDVYAIYASHDYTSDPLGIRREVHDSFTGRTYVSSFRPENSSWADGEGKPYSDPEQPGFWSPAEINFLGFRPKEDSYMEPYEPSRFLPTVTRQSAEDQLMEYQQFGPSSFSGPLSYNTFPKAIY